MKTKLVRSQLVRSRLCVFTLLTLITLIGCEKTELPNELVGTKWEQVDRYSLGLFYDSDDLWLKEKDNVFTKSEQ